MKRDRGERVVILGSRGYTKNGWGWMLFWLVRAVRGFAEMPVKILTPRRQGREESVDVGTPLAVRIIHGSREANAIGNCKENWLW
jgi:hypothetical protein